MERLEWVHDAFIEVGPDQCAIEILCQFAGFQSHGCDPSITEYRVMRVAAELRPSATPRRLRLWYGKDDKYDAVGFRCAVSE